MNQLDYIMRGDGELLLVIYQARRRTLRKRSRWALEFRQSVNGGGELSYELASGWTAPRFNMVEMRFQANMRELM